MVVNFCDTNIMIGAFLESQYKCDTYMGFLSRNKNIMISKRSFKELDGIQRILVSGQSKIFAYIQNGAIITKTSLKRHTKTFIGNCGKRIQDLKKLTDMELLSEIRNFTNKLKECCMRLSLFTHLEFVEPYENIDNSAIQPIEKARVYNIVESVITPAIEQWDGDRNLYVDAVANAKIKVNRKGIKKLVFLSGDGHFKNNKVVLENETNQYLSSLGEKFTIEINDIP